MQVIKRDGRLVEFKRERIVDAISKAMSHTIEGIDLDLATKIAESVEKQFENQTQVSVYEIQDAVEKKLMGSSRKEVAQSYITYRYNRDVARKSKTREMFIDIISAKANDITRENANMNADTPAGMMMKFASETTKPFVDDFLLSKEVREAVNLGYIHIHDKDYYPTKSLTCIQHPLDKILANGFKAGHGSSRPAKRIETASILGCISMETIQNEMHGGQAIPAFDYFLAPYVRKTFEEEIKKQGEILNEDITKLLDTPVKDYIKKDLKGIKGKDRIIQVAINRTVDRVHQSMEAFIHNMNTIHSRGGNQVVFSSINYGTDTSPEGRCVIRELLQSTLEGVGNNETAIFPIQIWKKKRGLNYLPEDRNYDLYEFSCKVAAKRFFPNYINLDAPYNHNDKWDESDPRRWYYECATMGCRTRVFENRHGEKTSIGRGNLSFTTINLPKIAIESALKAQEKIGKKFDLGIGSSEHMTDLYRKAVKRIFMNELEKYTSIAAQQLYERYQFQSTAIAKQFPLLMEGMWLDSEKLKPNDSVAEVLKHGTLSVGFIGLAETLVALTGKHHGESEESRELGYEIISHMRAFMDNKSEETGLNFTLLATPAEGLSGRFVRMDKKRFGEIPGVTDRDYYTNSFHVPVYYGISAFDKIKIEAPFHALTNAGHISYVELDGDTAKNPEAFEAVIRCMKASGIGYGSVNHPVDRDPVCGYTGVIDDVCPRCGRREGESISLERLNELRKKYPDVPVYLDANH